MYNEVSRETPDSRVLPSDIYHVIEWNLQWKSLWKKWKTAGKIFRAAYDDKFLADELPKRQYPLSFPFFAILLSFLQMKKIFLYVITEEENGWVYVALVIVSGNNRFRMDF